MNSSKLFRTTAFALLLSSAAFAGTNPGEGVKEAVISHVSSTNESLVFEVKVDNETGEKFSVLIKDINGVILYRGVYSDKQFAKKFYLPKPDDNKLIFVVKSASGHKVESFEINSNTKVVEEVVVKKVK